MSSSLDFGGGGGETRNRGNASSSSSWKEKLAVAHPKTGTYAIDQYTCPGE